MKKLLAFCSLLLRSGPVMRVRFDARSQSNLAKPGVNNVD